MRIVDKITDCDNFNDLPIGTVFCLKGGSDIFLKTHEYDTADIHINAFSLTCNRIAFISKHQNITPFFNAALVLHHSAEDDE